MNLEIITRCTRIDNILKVRDSIFGTPSYWKIKWRILFDTSVLGSVEPELLKILQEKADLYFWKGIPGDMGHGLINRVIDMIDDESWIYVLDDDNILHEKFLKKTYRLIQGPDTDMSRYDGVIFSQNVGGKDFSGLDIRVAASENVCVSKIDFAQFILKKSLIGLNRLAPNTYVADGIFIQELYAKFPDKILIHDEVLCNYNELQEKKQQYSLPRILVSGEEFKELKSIKHAKYESDELYLVNPDNDSIIKAINKHNPDCFLTVGKHYSNFSKLCKLSYDFRQRWIHCESTENIGEVAYNCAMHSILNPNTSDLVSIFTSVYNTGEKLRRTYESIKNQTHSNWEWVVVNDSTDSITGKIVDDICKEDPRVKVYEFKEKSKGVIGEAKYRACVLSRGEYLVELDHDDYLCTDAIQLMLEAFNAYPTAGFCYSDCAEIDENYNSLTYGEGFALGYGKYREEIHFNRLFKFAVAPNINPLTIRHIVGVPNHFRAWRRETYFKAGCHNRRLSIADDYELFIRTFLSTQIVKVQRGCYLQFFHGLNSQDSSRADIQRRVRTIANNYNDKIKERFEQFGKIDWAYSNERPSILTPPKFGKAEEFINFIFTK